MHDIVSIVDASSLLAAIVDSTDDAIFSTDLDGIVRTWNAAAERIFGYSADEMIGSPRSLALPASQIGEKSGFLAQIHLGKQRVRGFESILQRKDGTSFPASLTSTPVLSPSGQSAGVVTIVRDITPQKEMAEAALLSERQASLIADATPALISYVDSQLRYRFVNREYERWFGQPQERLLGRTLSEVLGEQTMKRLRPFVDSALAGQEVHFETEAPYLEGGTRWIEAHYIPHRGVEGRVVGFYVMVSDVSKRKRAEEELRESERRYRELAEGVALDRNKLAAVIESMAHPVMIADASGRFLSMNQSSLRLHSIRSVTELEAGVGRLAERFEIRDADGQLLPLTEWPLSRAGRGEQVDQELQIYDRATERRWTGIYTGGPVRNQSGDVVVIVLTMHDITERKRMEKALRESETRYRTIAEAMPHLVWSARPDGTLEYFNQKWTDYTGLSYVASQGGGWFQAVHSDDLPRVLRLWRDALQSESPMNCDYRLRSRDGTFRWFKSWGIPLRETAGRVSNWFGACTDIDDVVRAREVLSQARDELEKTVQERTAKLQEMITELETFSYSIAHDMRAPLRAMEGFAGAVLEDYGDRVGAEGKDYLQRIKAAAARQDHFIRDVLNYSRLVRQELVLERLDLDVILRDLVREYPNLQVAKESIQIEPPLGTVWGHAPSLAQCLSNLLGNALKFVAPGTIPRVRVWSRRQGPRTRLVVEDNGVGISEENYSRVFRLFERLHGQDEYPGTGIGLAVVRKAVERMGGSVGLESELGKGSRFWLELRACP